MTQAPKIVDLTAHRSALRMAARTRLLATYAGPCSDHNIFSIVDGGAEIDLFRDAPSLNVPANLDLHLALERSVAQALAGRTCRIEGATLPGAAAGWILPLVMVDIALRRPDVVAQVVRDENEVTAWTYVGLQGLALSDIRPEVERSIAGVLDDGVVHIDILVERFRALLRRHGYVVDPVIGRQPLKECVTRAKAAAR